METIEEILENLKEEIKNNLEIVSVEELRSWASGMVDEYVPTQIDALLSVAQECDPLIDTGLLPLNCDLIDFAKIQVHAHIYNNFESLLRELTDQEV